MTVFRALVVDDEPLARRGILTRLERETDIEVVGEAEDGFQAVEAIRSLKPDLVFLDVQMPGIDGFQVLERVSADHLPIVIFVTAHDVHAIQAFEVHALDYLLKPYSEQRFQTSLTRARVELARGAGAPETDRLTDLIAALDAARAGLTGTAPKSYPQRLRVRDRDRILMVSVDSIEAVRSAGNYVELVAGGKTHLMRVTLSEMESQLDPARFTRIHRSTIVSADRIREIRPEPHGDCDVVMESGAIYHLSRSYRGRLLPESGGTNA